MALKLKMEFQKNVNLFDTTFDDKNLSRFVTEKWIEVFDQSEKNYIANKEIKVKTPMLRSDLCDFSDVYIVVKGVITVTDPDNAKRNKNVAFQNNALFINCISKINGVQIDNAEDSNVVMPIYNLLEYAEITQRQQAVCGIITEMNQAILFLLILNLLNTRQALQEILTMLVMVKMVMMETKLAKMKLKLLFH